MRFKTAFPEGGGNGPGHAYLSLPPLHRRRDRQRDRREARTRRLLLAKVGLEVLNGSQGRRHVLRQVHHGRQFDIAWQLALCVQRGLGVRHTSENPGDLADLEKRASSVHGRRGQLTLWKDRT